MGNSNSKYCNLLTIGEGLVVDIHTEKSRWGESFLACRIKALHGLRDELEYLDYDARVVGKQAADLINKAQKAVTAGCDVLISFRAGVRWLCLTTHGEGHPRAGEIDIVQKARLLFIHWMDVDGVRIYTTESNAVRDSHVEDTFNRDSSSQTPTLTVDVAAAEPPALTASA
jgi:hypothetical protein